ncbi:MAG: DUF1566 domain-containing protein [Bdellovibrionales bacterium]|nr:DUF1566 domain-containing protein [Bdellovibrionales bacterium]
MRKSLAVLYFTSSRWVAAFLVLMGVGFPKALAQVPSSFTYQGQITKASGQPLEANPVVFNVRVYSPTNDCLLYEEQHSINMLGSDGAFSLNVGNGIRSGSDYEDTSLLSDIMKNSISFSGITTCSSGSSYSALAGHTRKVRISYNDGSGSVTLAQDFHLQSVPYAWYANSLQGFTASNFVQINPGQNITQTNLENLLGGTNYNTLYNLASGTSASPLNLNNQQIKNLSDPTLAQDAATKNYADTKIAGANIDVSTVGAGVGNGRVLSWNATLSRWEAITPVTTDATKLPLAGGTMAGNINMSGSQVLNSGHITLQNLSTITLGKFTNTQEATLGSTLGIGNKGAAWYNSDTDKIMYWDGNSAEAVGSGGGGNGDIEAIATVAGSALTGGVTSGTATLSVVTDNSSIETNGSNQLQVKDAGIGNTKLSANAVTSNKIDDGTIATADIGNSQVTDVKINSVSVNKIANGLGLYFNYQPNGGACAVGEVLKLTLNGWECGIDNNSGGVTTVFGRNGAVIAQSGDYIATQITNTPAGNIAATTAQAALNELDTEKLNKSGDTMTGALILPANGLTVGTTQFTASGGSIGIGTATPSTKLDVEGTLQIGDGGETCSVAANAGMIKYASGSLQYCNGSSWQILGISGAGLTSLGGQTGSTQTFAVNSSGNAPAITSGSNIHTLSIPLASSSGVTSGTISKADYDAFTAKLSAVTGSSLNSARLWVGDSSNLAQPVNLSGDATLSNTGALTIANNAITSAKINDGAITNSDINSSAAIAWSKIDKTGATATDVGAAPSARNVNTNSGSGLSGGGDLSADRSLSINVDDSTIEISTNTVRVKDSGITNAKINSVGVSKITSAATEYFSYMPAGTECLTNEVLKWDAASDRWICGADNNSGAVTSVFTRTGAVVAQSGDYTATQISNTPAGNIAASTAQAALDELDLEKVNKSGDAMTGALALNAQSELRFADGDSSNYLGLRAPATVGTNITWTLPSTDGTNGQILSTNGSGVLSWANASSGSVTSLTGDVTSTGSGAVATTVVKLQGYDVATTAPVDGQFFKYIGGGSTEWLPADIKFFDIKDNLGNSAFVGMGSCTNGQTVKWSSLTDTFECQAIGSLPGSVIASGTIDAARLPAASISADGIVNQIAQSFSGIKTFVNNMIAQGTLTVTGLLTANGGVSTTTLTTSGAISASGDIVTLGGVKIGTVGTSCNGTTEGTIRYNSSAKKMEFCNGTIWANISSGTQASLAIGSPSSSLVKSGPVTYTVTYGSGTDTATITLAVGNITIGGSATAGCSVTSVTGAGSTRTVTVNGCTGTGNVSISIAANTAQSTTGDQAPSAGPSSTYNVDNTGPTAPTGVSLGSVPSNLTNSPTITYSAASDVGGSTVANHQVRIERTSDNFVIYNWTNHTSGSDVGSLSLATNTQYSVYVRAMDALGNIGTATAATNWTTINDPCLGSPSPGTTCAGGAIYLGSLSPGATSGSGTDKYMTTPGGCGEIPAGQQGGGSGSTIWPNADFTPTCSGTDSLTKTWNDGSSNWYDIPGLTNYTSTIGTGAGASNTDQYYGSQNTGNIVAITSAGQGGYHAAARYCDRLSYGGYTDWHLPNRYELNLFYTNRASISGLDQTGNWYWASTEYNNTDSWIQRFSDGYQKVAILRTLPTGYVVCGDFKHVSV